MVQKLIFSLISINVARAALQKPRSEWDFIFLEEDSEKAWLQRGILNMLFSYQEFFCSGSDILSIAGHFNTIFFLLLQTVHALHERVEQRCSLPQCLILSWKWLTWLLIRVERKEERREIVWVNRGEKKPPGILLVFPQRSSEVLIKLFSNYVEKAVLFWPRQRTEEAGMQWNKGN